MSKKKSNIIGKPKEIDDEPLLNDLKKFLQYLWWIINVAEHSDPEITKEERYEKALIAIMGDEYAKWTKPPGGYTYNDMREIKLEENETGKLRGAIRKLIEDRLPPLNNEKMDIVERIYQDAEREAFLNKEIEKIEQHLNRNKHLYEGEFFEKGRGGFPWEADIDDI